MPENAVYVGPSSRWGNPYTVFSVPKSGTREYKAIRREQKVPGNDGYTYSYDIALYNCLKMYHKMILCGGVDLSKLRGKDLVCWCRLDRACHADILLELANGE